MRIATGLLVLVLMGGTIGCEYDDTSSPGSESAGAESSVAAAASTPAPAGSDQGEWDAISWKTGSGPSAAGAQQVMTLDAEVTSDARFIQFAYDRFPWSSSGLGHFFVWDGSRWVGGKFEWIRSGGQTLKETTNIRNGYNGLSIPPSGSAVAFAWTNENGTERSNLVKTTWP